MTKTNNNNFTTESQLTSKYSTEISDFWLTGEFAHFSGVNNARINYVSFIHNETSDVLNNSSDTKCLVISSGRTEGYLKYKELSFDLFNLGFNIFLIDHRGQGLSERALENTHKGYVENFQYYVDDLAVFIDNIVNPHCIGSNQIQKPYLLAHSMGGAIAARYLQDYPDSIQAAVLSSPMLGFNGGGIPNVIAELLVKTTAQMNKWFGDTPWYFFGQKNYEQMYFVDNPLTHSE
jgi:lysophospholipase